MPILTVPLRKGWDVWRQSWYPVNSHKVWSFTVILFSPISSPPLFYEPPPTSLSSSFYFPSGRRISCSVLSHMLQLLNPPRSSPLVRLTYYWCYQKDGLILVHCWSEKSNQSKQQMKHAQRHSTAAFKRKKTGSLEKPRLLNRRENGAWSHQGQ